MSPVYVPPPVTGAAPAGLGAAADAEGATANIDVTVAGWTLFGRGCQAAQRARKVERIIVRDSFRIESCGL